jgi:hypothetical protein
MTGFHAEAMEKKYARKRIVKLLMLLQYVKTACQQEPQQNGEDETMNDTVFNKNSFLCQADHPPFTNLKN